MTFTVNIPFKDGHLIVRICDYYGYVGQKWAWAKLEWREPNRFVVPDNEDN